MILCMGECMVELAPADGGLYRQGFAGDTFNTAWYLHQLGQKVGYFTCIGTDAVSDRMLDFFAAQGMATDHVGRIADRTPGLYMIALKDGERSFAYWRDRAAARLLARDADALDSALDSADVLVLSGITLAVLDSDADRQRLLDGLARRRRQGAQVLLDPNMRPRLWPDADAMRHWIMAGAAVATHVLPSFDEDGPTFGDEGPQSTIARYRDAGVDIVVVKDGVRPLTAWSAATGIVTHQPQPVERPVDTTAAGDSFNAGFLDALLRGGALADALAAGAAVSARVIMARGALVPLG